MHFITLEDMTQLIQGEELPRSSNGKCGHGTHVCPTRAEKSELGRRFETARVGEAPFRRWSNAHHAPVERG